MGRTKKATEVPETVEMEEVVVDNDTPETVEMEENIPSNVKELMRLYPQYEEIWVTARGFVHPKDTPKYLLKDATLYKNIYFNN